MSPEAELAVNVQKSEALTLPASSSVLAQIPKRTQGSLLRMFTDPHLLARRFFWDAPHPKAGPIRQLGSPMRFSRTPVRRDTAGPLLGADTAGLLAELGYEPDEVSTLVEKRVVKAS